VKCDKNKTEDGGKMILDISEKLNGKKIDQGVYYDLLFNLVIWFNYNKPIILESIYNVI